MLLLLVQLTSGFRPLPTRAHRPVAPLRRPLLASAELQPDGGDGRGEAGGLQQWVQDELLNGVALNPSTYAIMATYFVQGALGLAALARTYFLKDQLGLSPGEQAALMGITTLPWVIKPVYGFLTDGLPIFGYRRKPYLILAGILGSASWASLATVVDTPTQAVVASTIASLGVAMSDVVVDSLVVQRAREDETASSGALQSLCWTCQSSGGLAVRAAAPRLLLSPPRATHLQRAALATTTTTTHHPPPTTHHRRHPPPTTAATHLLRPRRLLSGAEPPPPPWRRQSAYFSGSLLETMRPQQVFGITALLPLLVALMALQLDETPVARRAEGSEGGPLQDFVQLTRRQGALLWETVKQRQAWQLGASGRPFA